MAELKATLNDISKTVNSLKSVLENVNDDHKMIMEILATIHQIAADINSKYDEMLKAGIKKPKTRNTKNDDDTDIEKDDASETSASKAPRKKKTETEVAKKAAPRKKNNVEPSEHAESAEPAEPAEPVEPAEPAEPAEQKKKRQPKAQKPEASEASVETPETPEVQAVPAVHAKPIVTITNYFKNKYTEDPTAFDSILEENQAKAVLAANTDKLESKKGVQKVRAQADLIFKSLTPDQKKKIYAMKETE